jgi:hypothetical protein
LKICALEYYKTDENLIYRLKDGVGIVKRKAITIQNNKQSSERELVAVIVNVPIFYFPIHIESLIYGKMMINSLCSLNLGDSSRDDEVSLFFETINNKQDEKIIRIIIIYVASIHNGTKQDLYCDGL